jgi:tungstate transport system substrate-binding protein
MVAAAMKRLSVSLIALVALLLPGLAHASDVIVQGTTDVRDAGLLDDVIIPGFQKAYPQYTLKYIAVGTGQALTNAEAGQGDAVLTHAPTQEQDFVNAGYSAEPSGRAIFYSDYVIVGPKNDPAGVLSGAAHNAAQAFQLIAAAGEAGKANFVSRGDNSGTNTEEKQIWKLTNVPLNSAGEPGSGSSNPSWYHKANAGQGPTVQVADQCPFSGGGCYDITDRGTFNRLVTGGAITRLQVVADKNDASAPGGPNLLVNSFHAYAVNAQKVSSVNVQGAKAFLDYLTSPAFQARLASYPSTQQPAFFADARPTLELTSRPLPRTVAAGTRLEITGTLTDNLPGYPVISGPALTLQTSHVPAIFAAATIGPPATNPLAVRRIAKGAFTFVVPAARSGNYQISFPGWRDLSPSTYSLGKLSVLARVTLSKVRRAAGGVRLSGRALPSTQRDSGAMLVVYGRHSGQGKFRKLRSFAAPNHRSRFLLKLKLGTGRWQLRVQYRDGTVVRPGTSRALSVSVR